MSKDISLDRSIISCFPYDKYGIREAQRKVLEGIDMAIQAGKNYIIIQAPTGVGKSAISYALLRYFEEGYVCTGTKALQDQYLGDFETLLTIKGRNNFFCLQRTDGASCEKGACEIMKLNCDRKPSSKLSGWPAYFSVRDNVTKYWQKGPGHPRCPYWISKVNALNNFGVVHNYKYILTEANFVGEFTKKKVLISDEGHNIEGQLIDFIKLPITQDNLDVINKFLDPIQKQSFIRTNIKMSDFDKLQAHKVWVEELNLTLPTALDRIKALAMVALEEKNELEREARETESEIKKRELADLIKIKMNRLDDLKGDQNKIESLQEFKMAFFLRDIAANINNWVIKEEYSVKGEIVKIEFQPIRVNKYAHDKYLRLGEINIIMSATILDYTRVAYDLGIDLKDVEYIEIEPPFPAENHKIFNLRLANFGWREDETLIEKTAFFKAIVGKIDLILELFPWERGIIHSTTYEIAKAIQKYSKNQERLTFHNAKNRIQKLEEHKQKIGSVLISPSMTEGIDLKDDFSRFQILVKVPYPDLSDERIKKRKMIDPPSYPFRTANTIIQAVGRSVRSETDTAITFTLDSRFGGFLRRHEKMMGLFNRHVLPNSKLIELECLKNEPEVLAQLLEPIHRAEKEKDRNY